MRIGFTLTMTDSSSAIYISHELIIYLSKLIDSEGFDDRSNGKYSGLDVNIWINSLPENIIMSQSNLVKLNDSGDVFLHNKIVKPKNYNWFEAYIRFNYEVIKLSNDKLKTFLRMLRDSIELVSNKTGIIVLALNKWSEISNKIIDAVAEDKKYRFSREVESGSIIA